MLGVALSALLLARMLLLPSLAVDYSTGFVSLCAGGEVVWVAAEGVAPTDDTSPRIPCPWLGLSALPEAPGALLPAHVPVPLPARQVSIAAEPHSLAKFFAPQAPRAPPLPERA